MRTLFGRFAIVTAVLAFMTVRQTTVFAQLPSLPHIKIPPITFHPQVPLPPIPIIDPTGHPTVIHSVADIRAHVSSVKRQVQAGTIKLSEHASLVVPAGLRSPLETALGAIDGSEVEKLYEKYYCFIFVAGTIGVGTYAYATDCAGPITFIVEGQPITTDACTATVICFAMTVACFEADANSPQSADPFAPQLQKIFNGLHPQSPSAAVLAVMKSEPVALFNAVSYLRNLTQFSDVDGDKRMDAIAVNKDGITVRRSNGTSFLNNEKWTQVPYFGKLGTFFADVDGDGKSDAIVLNADTITIRRSKNGSFSPNEDWTHGAYFGTISTHFADVNGDKRADAIVVNEDRIVVRLSTGSQFANEQDWSGNPYYGVLGTYFADVDGDGKADAIVINPDKITVRQSDGARFKDPVHWTANRYFGSLGTFFSDVDGDGKADAVVVNPDKVTVRRSDGHQFGQYEAFTANPYYGNLGTALADIDGDQKADSIVINPEGLTARRSDGTKFLSNMTMTPVGFYGSLK